MASLDEPFPLSVSEYERDVISAFKVFAEKSEKIGKEVAGQTEWALKGVEAQRDFLLLASKMKQPPREDLPRLLKPQSDIIRKVQSFKENSKDSPLFNHIAAVSEIIPALGWVTVEKAPSTFVKEMKDAGQFYLNRVLKEWRRKDGVHAEWAKGLQVFLSSLQAYVNRQHPTGLTWSRLGHDEAAGFPVKSHVRGPPRPEAPPEGDKLGKHPSPPLPRKSSTKANLSLQKSRLELVGKKWMVEGFVGDPNIHVKNVEINQSVYVFGCKGATVKVNGKCNNITLDKCSKTAVLFDAVVSSVEFVNCQAVKMQVLGKVPTISVHLTDGCQLYLSKDALDTEILTSKSSETNVLIPVKEDFVEQAIPEQFKTRVEGTKLRTTIQDNY